MSKGLHSIFNALHACIYFSMGLQYYYSLNFMQADKDNQHTKYTFHANTPVCRFFFMHCTPSFVHYFFFPFEVFTSTVCLSHKLHKCCALQVASMLCWVLSKVTQIYQQWNFTSGFTNTRAAIVWPHVHVSLFEVAVNWKVHAKAAGSL